jgi:hypothetical protein
MLIGYEYPAVFLLVLALATWKNVPGYIFAQLMGGWVV